jgi:hypothetical protein
VWCSQTGDHPHEDLAKFGYGPVMKDKNKEKESFYILATLLEAVVEIWRFNFFPFEI